MRAVDIIKKKRDGGELTADEIRAFIAGYVSGEIPDYQAAALCMAIWFRGMTVPETTELTLAVRDSGACLDTSGIEGLRVDKHSTGGVGDKTSLVVSPIVASLGLTVAKMSGRGLGHTGGTIDKLESIPGLRADLSVDEFKAVVRKTGIAIVGQSTTLAPADKLLYALRDVTATVDSMPLIASSIMGKKLAANDDCIVLDVKTGSGAFMKDEKDSRTLARLMVDIGTRAGKQICALITDMDQPLGNAIGNSLEVVEAIEVLRGGGPEDLRELCITLAAHILRLGGRGSFDACREWAERALSTGAALDTFAQMVEAQGGDKSCIYDPARLPEAKHRKTVYAMGDGYIKCVDTEGYGTAALLLGAGRSRKEDSIDYTAGIYLHAKVGAFVRAGEKIATLYTTEHPEAFGAAEEKLLSSTVLSSTAPTKRPLIFDVIEG